MEEEKKISIDEIAELIGQSPMSVKQMCETGQIPADAYVVVDKGTAWETKFFYLSKVKQALRKKAKEIAPPADLEPAEEGVEPVLTEAEEKPAKEKPKKK